MREQDHIKKMLISKRTLIVSFLIFISFLGFYNFCGARSSKSHGDSSKKTNYMTLVCKNVSKNSEDLNNILQDSKAHHFHMRENDDKLKITLRHCHSKAKDYEKLGRFLIYSREA